MKGNMHVKWLWRRVGQHQRRAGCSFSPLTATRSAIGHWATHVLNGAILTRPYDVLDDFKPVGLIATGPQLIIGKKALPAKTLTEFIAWLKDNPGKAAAGTAGPGTGSHVAAVFFQNQTGMQFSVRPLSRRWARVERPDGRPHRPDVRSGFQFAEPSARRNRESLRGDREDPTGIGAWAPKQTPKEVIAKLNAALRDALADPAVRSRLADLGQELPSADRQAPDVLAQHQKAEVEKWWPIIKAANIKGE
jgi:tripartite-type tricarboxylate transporter receptor subunit TctC